MKTENLDKTDLENCSVFWFIRSVNKHNADVSLNKHNKDASFYNSLYGFGYTTGGSCGVTPFFVI